MTKFESIANMERNQDMTQEKAAVVFRKERRETDLKVISKQPLPLEINDTNLTCNLGTSYFQTSVCGSLPVLSITE